MYSPDTQLWDLGNRVIHSQLRSSAKRLQKIVHRSDFKGLDCTLVGCGNVLWSGLIFR